MRNPMIFGKQKMILICLFSLISFNTTLAEIPECTPQKKEALDTFLNASKNELSLKIISSELLKSKWHYNKFFNTSTLKDSQGNDYEFSFYFYKSKAKTYVKKKPLVFILSGIVGITLLERYIANFFTRSGVSVIVSDFKGLHSIDTLEKIKPAISIAIKSTLSLVDYGLSRNDIDHNKLAVVGISLGGFRSLYLMSLEKKIKAASLVVTGSSLSEAMAYSSSPIVSYLRHTHMNQANINDVDLYAKAVREQLPFTPTEFICTRQRSEFFLFNAKKDITVPYSLQKKLWKELGYPLNKHTIFGHYAGALLFGAKELKNTLSFFNYHWKQSETTDF